jgi:hypothetical protein
MNRASGSYAAFMLQGPVLVALALALRPTDLPGDVKSLVVATLSIVDSFALSWRLVTRTPSGTGHVSASKRARRPLARLGVHAASIGAIENGALRFGVRTGLGVTRPLIMLNGDPFRGSADWVGSPATARPFGSASGRAMGF